MVQVIVEFIGLFFAGMLAGQEFVVRFGVRGPLAALDDRAHIQLRLGLIRTLRWLVPAAAVPALVAGVVAAVADGAATGVVVRWAGVLALVVWFLVTVFGTVPINAGALDNWRPDAPPPGWKVLVDRWERLNTARAVAALLAFVLFLTAAAVRLAPH